MNEIKFAQLTGMTSPNPLTLVCTKKEDGTTNLSTISWWMPLSFNPNLFAVAINHGSHGGDRLRETGEAVLVIPAVGSEGFIFGCDKCWVCPPDLSSNLEKVFMWVHENGRYQ